MANTTIILSLGYATFAMPYTDKRVAAIADLMAASTRVNLDYRGNMTTALPEDDPSDMLSFHVVQQDIPVYEAPIVTTINSNTIGDSEADEEN